MKILMCNNYYYPNVLGGAEVSVQTLAEKLVERGVSVCVLSLSAGQVAERFIHNGVEVIAMPDENIGHGQAVKTVSNIKRLLWHVSAELRVGLAGNVSELLDEICPDVVNTFNLAGLSTTLWRGIKQRQQPLVHTLFGSFLVCFRGPMFRNGHDCINQCTSCRFLTAKRKLHTGLVDAVVSDSSAVLDRHLDHGYFSSTPIKKVINCGFRRDDDSEQLVAARQSDRVRIGFIGRLHPTKGVEVLLEACRKISVGNWEVLIAGKGEANYQRNLQNEYTDEWAHFIGWQDTEEFLSGIDVLVAPSIWNDPLPRVVFEAFSVGVPVIGSRIGGIPEMIEDGLTGYMFEPHDSCELSAILQKVIVNPEVVSSMSNACLVRAQHFTAARFADDYMALYERLLSGHA